MNGLYMGIKYTDIAFKFTYIGEDMPKKSTKSKKAESTIQKRGRREGVSPETVILFNRHNCLFYTTIKDGKKVTGRDYTVHGQKIKDLQVAFTRAKDTLTTKLMKCVRDKEYKEDIFRAIPTFFDIEKDIDLGFYPPGLFENGDKMISRVVDKEKALLRLDELVKETGEYLSSLGRPDLQTYLNTQYGNMKTENTPIGKTEESSPDAIQLKQLSMFKF